MSHLVPFCYIVRGSWKGGGNQYIQLVNALYYKLATNGKQLPAFPQEVKLVLNSDIRGGRRACDLPCPQYIFGGYTSLSTLKRQMRFEPTTPLMNDK